MDKQIQLRAFELFVGISATLIERLAMVTTRRQYPRGCTIYREGDHAEALYLLLEGRVKAQITDKEGRAVIVSRFQRGDTLGEMELVDCRPRGTELVAMTPCECLVIGHGEFKRMMEQSPELTKAVLLLMSSRLRQAHRNIATLATQDVVGRVERLLAEHAVVSDGEVVVQDLPNQKEIAMIVGASREMVNRVFRHLTDNGSLKSCDGRYILRKGLVAA